MLNTSSIGNEREHFWGQLLVEYDRRLRQYLRRAHVPHADVDDIVGEVWSRALSQETALRQSDAVWPPLLAVLREVRAEYACIERRERCADSALLDQLELALTLGETLDTLDRSNWAMQLPTRLPERQRQAVEMRYFLGKSFAEIGAAIGTAEATARVHVFRGIRQLRRLLSLSSRCADHATETRVGLRKRESCGRGAEDDGGV
jgi:RNA polymerase sigma factor (sigma-70 family)